MSDTTPPETSQPPLPPAIDRTEDGDDFTVTFEAIDRRDA